MPREQRIDSYQCLGSVDHLTRMGEEQPIRKAVFKTTASRKVWKS